MFIEIHKPRRVLFWGIALKLYIVSLKYHINQYRNTAESRKRDSVRRFARTIIIIIIKKIYITLSEKTSSSVSGAVFTL